MIEFILNQLVYHNQFGFGRMYRDRPDLGGIEVKFFRDGNFERLFKYDGTRTADGSKIVGLEHHQVLIEEGDQ